MKPFSLPACLTYFLSPPQTPELETNMFFHKALGEVVEGVNGDGMKGRRDSSSLPICALTLTSIKTKPKVFS